MRVAYPHVREDGHCAASASRRPSYGGRDPRHRRCRRRIEPRSGLRAGGYLQLLRGHLPRTGRKDPAGTRSPCRARRVRAMRPCPIPTVSRGPPRLVTRLAWCASTGHPLIGRAARHRLAWSPRRSGPVRSASGLATATCFRSGGWPRAPTFLFTRQPVRRPAPTRQPASTRSAPGRTNWTGPSASDGQPYRVLKVARLYRRKLVDQCSCQPEGVAATPLPIERDLTARVGRRGRNPIERSCGGLHAAWWLPRWLDFREAGILSRHERRLIGRKIDVVRRERRMPAPPMGILGRPGGRLTARRASGWPRWVPRLG